LLRRHAYMHVTGRQDVRMHDMQPGTLQVGVVRLQLGRAHEWVMAWELTLPAVCCL
jgi:hypothetical protein